MSTIRNKDPYDVDSSQSDEVTNMVKLHVNMYYQKSEAWVGLSLSTKTSSTECSRRNGEDEGQVDTEVVDRTDFFCSGGRYQGEGFSIPRRRFPGQDDCQEFGPVSDARGIRKSDQVRPSV